MEKAPYHSFVAAVRFILQPDSDPSKCQGEK